MSKNTKLQRLFNDTDPCAMVFDMYKSALRSHDMLTLNFEQSEGASSEDEIVCVPSDDFLDQFFQTGVEYEQHEDMCSNLLKKKTEAMSPNATFCKGEFDGFMCWPHGDPGSLVQSSCNGLISRTNNESKNGYRYCLSNGSWLEDMHGISAWSNNKECQFFTDEEAMAEKDGFIHFHIGEGFTALDVVTIIGYGASISCLILAIILLLSFKKLRCLTNYIHVHLMISFLIFCVLKMILEKQSSLQTLAYSSDPKVVGWCRVFTSLYHYSIIANYSWMLAEGVHLQVLLHFPLQVKYFFNRFATYFFISWGVPWIVIGVSIANLLRKQKAGCWSGNHWWLTRWSLYVIITVNFIIFLNVFRIIVCKSRKQNLSKNDSRCKLAKSLFALFALLGTHYVIFSVLTNVNEVEAKAVWLKWTMSIECFLTSFQGAAVAVFFCFLNTEVHKTVKRVWYDWNLKRRLPSQSNKPLCSTNGRDQDIDSPQFESGGKIFHYSIETSQPLIGEVASPVLSVITKI